MVRNKKESHHHSTTTTWSFVLIPLAIYCPHQVYSICIFLCPITVLLLRSHRCFAGENFFWCSPYKFSGLGTSHTKNSQLCLHHPSTLSLSFILILVSIYCSPFVYIIFHFSYPITVWLWCGEGVCFACFLSALLSFLALPSFYQPLY